MEQNYKVVKLMDKFEKYNNKEVDIKSKTKEFNFKFDINSIPHLLGLHYMNKDPRNKKRNANDNYKFIKKNNLTDDDILSIIEKNNGVNEAKKVRSRINTFEYFMDNLEKAFIVENTKITGDLPVNYFIIQDNNKKIRHLGIISSDNGALLINYEDEIKDIKDILNTYFINKNYKYFDKSNIIEDIEEIKIYDDILDKFIPLSFDEEKNKYLVKEFIKDEKNFNYQETIKEYEKLKDNKEVSKWEKQTSKKNLFAVCLQCVCIKLKKRHFYGLLNTFKKLKNPSIY